MRPHIYIIQNSIRKNRSFSLDGTLRNNCILKNDFMHISTKARQLEICTLIVSTVELKTEQVSTAHIRKKRGF